MTTVLGNSISKTATQGEPPIGEVAVRALESYETIELPDGRMLAYNEFGDPDGVPILVCHGWPLSRVMGAVFDGDARGTGARLICPDRPGIGNSDSLPDRRLTDWSSDAAALLDSLGIESIPILGVSSGGPYALACAVRIPERISAVGLVVSEASIEWRPDGSNLFLWAVLHLPPLARLLVRLNTGNPDGDPAIRASKLAEKAPAVDAAVYESPMGMSLVRAGQLALQNGSKTAVTDLGTIVGPWGFDLDEIEHPVACWQGTEDENVPVCVGEYLGDHIPGCHFHAEEGEAHVSLLTNCGDQILSELLELSVTQS